ncbi:Carbamoyl-phosphate synthase L chain, ATP-binding protein [Rubrobacter xylanophilus DSM 9941]|uniref:biotin carboxylase n=1 Tax=Rubrobacter xylanophilus (strain DSM 9941 / JCM 11954 / NBRC 16129 / PRD-1) TaxID=266117 RepID=Q1AT87_RUBXD|nr:acetyl-CoA carboxylase biotin carboxylase subunit [Rubrobacter xylanophilus]ABG05391.1 Carbamoyl-phosphate synthase L chain, ATP-binding protein [Rubrobacter xylanophilus DSM 9941]
MFEKVLVANRGEIAVRIIRACRELGLASVAVYSDVDREALHTALADEAYHIGPTPAAESYLNIGRLVEVARRSGAGAVHPGYGFLAESAAFARAVGEAGLVWIGPHPEAIEAMGSKVESRRLMARAGVPITPGTAEPVTSPKAVAEFAAEHGYPVAVKASAGGGGKGFAVARGEEEAGAAFERASREGEAYFGDGAVYLEKYLPHPRHIEIQVVCDRHGNAAHLGERDCSIQRRHQKLVEECPSPAMTPEMRERMGAAAVAAARAVGYDSVGTVEFLVQDEEFYFLEMNTRVQVEHPITEEVTGIDIVQTGIRIATGEPLPFAQEEICWRGHAIEVRLNAEDPASGFAPSPGMVTAYAEPGGPGVRVDSSLRGPGLVPESYDPLFAKLIVRGRDRRDALSRLRRALGEFRVEGIATTLPFFRAILDEESFLSGDYTTGYIAERMGALRMEPAPAAGGAPPARGEGRSLEVEVDGRLFRVRVFGELSGRGGAGVQAPPRRGGGGSRRASAVEGTVAAPMQGTIVKVLVREGQEVAADEPVCILEAMKMESEIRTPKAGRVAKVAVGPGQAVRGGDPLVVVE